MNTLFANSPDGTRVAYDLSGTGPAIVLLHGGGGMQQEWHEAGYVKRLRDSFTVITLDLRGHGESDLPIQGRVQYYTLWSEPDNCGGSQIKCIEPLDYIELASQTIPVIRQEDPQAQVVLAPNVLYFDREYLFTVLRSDVAPMFDVISWHGICDATPNNEFYGNYYYEYPTIIEEIKQTASAHGFDGEYWGTELTWCSEEFPTCHAPDQPWGIQKTDKIAAKYDARGFVMQLGMDVGVGWGGLVGVSATLAFPNLSAQGVIGIDVLYGVEQELITETENGNLVIRNLLVKDYPIILRLID